MRAGGHQSVRRAGAPPVPRRRRRLRPAELRRRAAAPAPRRLRIPGATLRRPESAARPQLEASRARAAARPSPRDSRRPRALASASAAKAADARVRDLVARWFVAVADCGQRARGVGRRRRDVAARHRRHAGRSCERDRRRFTRSRCQLAGGSGWARARHRGRTALHASHASGGGDADGRAGGRCAPRQTCRRPTAGPGVPTNGGRAWALIRLVPPRFTARLLLDEELTRQRAARAGLEELLESQCRRFGAELHHGRPAATGGTTP